MNDTRGGRSYLHTKRLVVLSDGTWQTAASKTPTNIVKLAMAVKLESDRDHAQQIVFYDSGIGTAGPLDRVRGGGLGDGIDANVLALYTFLAMNYDAGDEIYMFGFSRGSYTVRSLAALINNSGLVRRTEIRWVEEAYELYRSRKGGEHPDALNFRAQHGDRVNIKLLAWSLGLPKQFKKGTRPLSALGGPIAALDQNSYSFHNMSLPPIVEHAIHALSIDEYEAFSPPTTQACILEANLMLTRHAYVVSRLFVRTRRDREMFAPTPMEFHPQRGHQQLTQLYFAGTHGGVGGGDASQVQLSDFVLGWMIREMHRRGLALEFDPSRIPEGSVDVAPGRSSSSLLLQMAEQVTGKCVRQIEHMAQIHSSVVERYHKHPKWRPRSLEPLREQILKTRWNGPAHP